MRAARRSLTGTYRNQYLRLATSIVAFFAVPAVNVSFDTLAFDQSRAQQCQYNLPKPTDTGWNTTFSSLAGKSAQMPMWWALMHALSKGLTNGAVATNSPAGLIYGKYAWKLATPRSTTRYWLRKLATLRTIAMDPPCQIIHRQRIRAQGNDPRFAQELSWIGSHYLLNTSRLLRHGLLQNSKGIMAL